MINDTERRVTHTPGYDIAAEVKRANDRKLHSPEYWLKTGVPMPVKYLEDSIEIPESIKEPSPAMQLIGREIAPKCDPAQRRYDLRECKNAYNRMED